MKACDDGERKGVCLRRVLKACDEGVHSKNSKYKMKNPENIPKYIQVQLKIFFHARRMQ